MDTINGIYFVKVDYVLFHYHFFAFEFYETTEFPVYIIWKKGLNERRKFQNYMLLMFLRWIHSAFI